jgi:hypothetical protein
MYEVYVHELGTEGNRELMIASGIIDRQETISPAQIELQPIYCPICKEPNKHNAKFCFKCNFIISKEGWLEDKEQEAEAARKADEKEKELEQMREEQRKIMNNFKMIMPMLEKVTKKLRMENMEMRQALLEAGEEIMEEEPAAVENEKNKKISL